MPNSLVTSVSPGEFVVLLRPRNTRNPKLKTLRLKELASKVEEEMGRLAGVRVLTGIGSDYGTPGRLIESYQEARVAAGRAGRASSADEPSQSDDGEKKLARVTTGLHASLKELTDGVAHASVDEISAAFQKALRVIETCPEEDYETRRLLFGQVVHEFLNSATTQGADAGKVDKARVSYMRVFPSLRTMEDILEWFRTELRCIVAAVAELRSSPEQRAVMRACALTAQNIDTPLKRSDVAAQVGMSESHFGKVFRRRVGLSFRTYVQLARVARAQDLLLEPGKSVLDVAMEVGYADTASFTRAFSKIVGDSPTEYRKDPQAFKRVELPV